MVLNVAFVLWFARRAAVVVGHVWADLIVGALLCGLVVAAAAIDLEHMILPNELTLGGACIALCTAYWRGPGVLGALLGALVGFAVIYLPSLLYRRLRGVTGVGAGDVKLTLLAGAWLGAYGVLFVILAGAVQQAACALVFRFMGVTCRIPASVEAELASLRARAVQGDTDALAELDEDVMAVDVGEHSLSGVRGMRLPMGPFLVLGCLEFVLAGGQIVAFLERLLLGV
jgi:leader peptidase (prepilin peptidase)/N-methyltransferase